MNYYNLKTIKRDIRILNNQNLEAMSTKNIKLPKFKLEDNENEPDMF
jgi:hypothetical protein